MNKIEIPQALFGDSGFSLPKLGLGLAALGRPGYINLGHGRDLNYEYDQDKMEANTHSMLDEAYRLGIRYFDVAQSYGRSEKFISHWLEQRSASVEQAVVGSKWGYTYVANWQVQAKHHEVKEHSIEVLKRQWHFSSNALGDHLKLYQIHSATFESKVLSNFKVLDYLFEIKNQGYMIGITLSGVDQTAVLEKALKISVEEEKLFDAVQITYNIFERASEDVIKKAYDVGLAIIVKEALANGRLTNRNLDSTMAEQLSIINSIAKKHSVSTDAVALAYLNQKPFINMVLSGAATGPHLVSNLDMFNIELSAEEIYRLDSLQLSSKKYWNDRKQLVWN